MTTGSESLLPLTRPGFPRGEYASIIIPTKKRKKKEILVISIDNNENFNNYTICLRVEKQHSKLVSIKAIIAV